MDRYDFIIFTSVNGVSILFDNLYRAGDDARRLGRIKDIAIGDGTALALKSKGIIPDIIPERFTSEGIIDALKFIDIKGKTILLPRAEYGRDILPRYINDRGGSIDVIPLYKTILPKHVNPMTVRPDIVTFTSSSTVTNFIKLYGMASLEGTIIASIGPITSKRLRKSHIDVHVEAKRHDITGLLEALEAFLKGHDTLKKRLL
jgi:uroporphyrinogen III methyltransferase/synthase